MTSLAFPLGATLNSLPIFQQVVYSYLARCNSPST